MTDNQVLSIITFIFYHNIFQISTPFLADFLKNNFQKLSFFYISCHKKLKFHNFTAQLGQMPVKQCPRPAPSPT